MEDAYLNAQGDGWGVGFFVQAIEAGVDVVLQVMLTENVRIRKIARWNHARPST